MTRSDIGEYLGLTVETVSRIFTALQKKNLIAVNNRETEIMDFKGLRALIGSKAAQAYVLDDLRWNLLINRSSSPAWISGTAHLWSLSNRARWDSSN
jgi:hypothetical protein